MTSEEYLRCIKKINPDARVVVWQDTPESDPYPIWDSLHVGDKPTYEQCLEILSAVQAEMAAEKEAADREALIQAEIANIQRQQAIDKLTAQGKL